MSKENFTIRDNSSEFAKLLNNNWIEPLTIIARVKSYRGIDELILELIQDRLEMFTDSRDNLNDDMQTYFHNTIKGKDVPNEWASKQNEEESNHNTAASEFVKDVHENYHEMKKSEDRDKEELK